MNKLKVRGIENLIIQTRITSSRLMSDPKLQLNTKTLSSGKIWPFVHLKETKPPPFDSSLHTLASAASKGAQTHTKSEMSCYNKNPPGPWIHLILADDVGTRDENQKTTRAITIQIWPASNLLDIKHPKDLHIPDPVLQPTHGSQHKWTNSQDTGLTRWHKHRFACGPKLPKYIR